MLPESFCFELFRGGKYGLLLIQKVDVRWCFLQHGIPCFLNMEKFLLWTFRRWEIRSSFDSKSWRKMIYSLPWNTKIFEYGKVLVLNISQIENTIFFWSKKLMKSWYFLGIFELFMISQDLGNMVFRSAHPGKIEYVKN